MSGCRPRVLNVGRKLEGDKKNTFLDRSARILSIPLLCYLCVTGSVTVRSQQDSQDATGHDSIIEPYLSSRGDFMGKIASSEKAPIRFSRPPPFAILPPRNRQNSRGSPVRWQAEWPGVTGRGPRSQL